MDIYRARHPLATMLRNDRHFLDTTRISRAERALDHAYRDWHWDIACRAYENLTFASTEHA